jgi:hypothetical protein
MGGVFCSSKKTESKHNQGGNQNGMKAPAKSRVNDTDKSILEVKARLRKLKTYTDKLKIDCEKQKAKV